MGGLFSFFKKVIPIMTLICFISLGISYIFNIEGLTYLTKHTIEINGTQSNYYTFDVATYFNNMDIQILKSAINNVIDINAFKHVIDIFDLIWRDGYQLFDLTKSMANAIVLVIDGLITLLDIIIVPLRIIAGLLLTGLNLIGINISNQNSIIINTLKAILNLHGANNGPFIPLIDPLAF